MIKTLSRVGVEGTYINIIKAICEKPTANIILNGEKLKALPLRLGTRRMSAFTSLVQHSTWSCSHSNQTRRIIKRHPIWKEKLKLSLFADDMILYIENPKDSTKKLPELINEFSKVAVAGHKLISRNQLHFYMPIMN